LIFCETPFDKCSLPYTYHGKNPLLGFAEVSLLPKGEMIKISLFGKEGLREILIDYLLSDCFLNSSPLKGED
jgi:hypothetical protein